MVPDANEDAPLPPEASLLLIAEEQQAATRRLDVDPARFLAPWGLAWFAGYGLLFLRHGPDERVFVSMPAWLPQAVLFTLLAAAGVVSSVHGPRATRGVAGVSAERGTGPGWHSLVVAVLGGGAMLAAAALSRLVRPEAPTPRATSS